MVCRSLLLQIEQACYIQLPSKRCSPNYPLVRRKKPDLPSLDQALIELDLCRLPEFVIRQVRRLPEERLFNALIEHHHYLGYRQPVGEHLKHPILMGERPIACFSWPSTPRTPRKGQGRNVAESYPGAIRESVRTGFHRSGTA